MAVSFSNLTMNGSTAGTSSYNTAAVTPVADNVVLLAVGARLASGNGPGAVSSVSGCGLTWSVWEVQDFGPVQGSARTVRFEVWVGVGASPSNGAITITWGTSPTSCSWCVDQSAGAASVPANAKGNVVNFDTDNTLTASPATANIASFQDSASGTFGAIAIELTGQNVDANVNFTELGHTNTQTPTLETEYAATNQTTVSAAFAGGVNKYWGVIGIEIKVPSANPATDNKRRSSLAWPLPIGVPPCPDGTVS